MDKRKIHLDWYGYCKYNLDNIDKYVPEKAGVYKIGVLQKSSGKLKVHYVGQTINLNKRLKEHLDFKNEENECLVKHLRKYYCKFKFARVSLQNNRDGAERALCFHYTPECNDPDIIPDGPDIDINND